MPAFHREQIDASVETMADGGRARARAAGARGDASTSTTGRATSRCGSRCGRCSASTPTTATAASAAAEHFERALSFYGTDYHLRLLRGPGSPWRRMHRLAQDRSTGSSTARSSPARAPATAATRHPQPAARGARRGRLRRSPTQEVRDQADDADVRRPRHLHLDPLVPPLRARAPPRRARAAAGRAGRGARRPRRRRRAARSASSPTSTWSSTRRCASTRRPGSARGARCAGSSSAATGCPAGAYVNYCSWASHRLPEVFPEPEAFIPERFSARAQGGAPARRLRPVRRRLADLHRQALRPDRGQARRDAGPAAAALRAAARAGR